MVMRNFRSLIARSGRHNIRLLSTGARLFNVAPVLSSSILSSLFLKCSSCGIRLQTEDKNKPGFYIKPGPKEKLIKHEDAVFNEHFSGLSKEDKMLLMNSDVPMQNIASKNQDESSTGRECTRCRDFKYRSRIKTNELSVQSLTSILSHMPPYGNLVYVVNAQDFPSSIDKTVFAYRKPSEVKFVINKVDLLFRRLDLANKYGLKFFQDFLSQKFGVLPQNVCVASGLIHWNIERLMKFLDNDSYLIGNVNSGKSLIVGALLYEKEKSKQLSSSDRTRLEKEQDRAISKNLSLSRAQLKQNKQQAQNFKQKHSPGVSYLPGFTRDTISFDLGDKSIHDVPGFTSLGDHGIHGLMNPKVLKLISKGVKVFKRGLYDSKYDTVKGEQCLTIGGLFYLIPPKNSIYQVRNCINYDMKVFSGFAKTIDRFSKIEQYPALQKFFLMSPETLSDLQLFIVPPFYGSIDIVVKNIGHINIKPTGRKMGNEPALIYLPKGIEAIVRQPISEYIVKTLTGRDVKGNVLRKENWVKKSVAALKRYSGDVPFSCSLIPVEIDPIPSADPQKLDPFRHISRYLSHIKSEPIEFTPTTSFGEENKYDYWIEDSKS